MGEECKYHVDFTSTAARLQITILEKEFKRRA